MAGPVIVQGSAGGAATGPATVVALSGDGHRLRLLERAPATSARPETEAGAEPDPADLRGMPAPGAAPRTPTTTDGAD